MQVILQADQRPKQNHKDALLPAHPQELYLLEKELGPMLNQENIQSLITKCRRNRFIFFVMEVYPEKVMERLNSGESKTIFRNISCIVIIGLKKSGRKAWQEEEEETRKDTIIVLILQEQSCTSELFKDIQDAVSLILLFAGQCHYSEWFLPVHLSHWMCNQFTLHHQFGFDTGRTKFEQQTDSILSACGSCGQRTQGS